MVLPVQNLLPLGYPVRIKMILFMRGNNIHLNALLPAIRSKQEFLGAPVILYTREKPDPHLFFFTSPWFTHGQDMW